MWLSLLAFEWRYQTRRLVFLAAASLFGLFGFASAASGFGPGGLAVNAPYAVSLAMGLASLGLAVAVTPFVVRAALRDQEHRMAEVVYATAVGKPAYLFGRFAGVVLATATAFAATPIGMVAGTLAHAAELGDGRLPFAPLTYLWPFLVLGIPNLLLVAALAYAVATLSRSALATYTGGVLVYMLYFATAVVAGSPLIAGAAPPTARALAIGGLVDPFGLTAVFAIARHWSLAERGVRLLPLAGPLLANRLLWLAIAGCLLLVAYRRFRFRLPVERASGRDEPQTRRYAPAVAPATAMGTDDDWRLAVRQLTSLLRLEMRLVIGGWPLVVLLAGWIGMLAIELMQQIDRAELGTRLLPTSGLLVGHLAQPLTGFGLVVLVFFAAELVWRERTVGIAELIDSTPLSAAAQLAAKMLGLLGILALLWASGVAVAIAVQLIAGATAVEPLPYLGLLAVVGPPLTLVAVLLVVIQVLVPNRHLGLLVGLAAVAWWHRGLAGGPEHPLLRYAAAPEVAHSAFFGFAPSQAPLAWSMAYWSLVAALLALLGTRLRWVGTAPRTWQGLRRRWRGGGRAWRCAVAVTALAWCGVAVAAYRQTNVIHQYRGAQALAAWKAEYERTYRWLEGTPQPAVVDVRLAIDLVPETRRARVRGSYQLENRTQQPIDELWVVTRRDLAGAAVSVGGAVEAVDRRFGVRSFALSTPLEAGGRVRLDFDLELAAGGLDPDGPDYALVDNGSVLFGYRVLPALGYHRGYELRDPAERRRQGLPERPRATTLAEVAAGDPDGLGEVRSSFDVTVSTAPDQIAIAPGRLVGEEERIGRRVFHYRTEQPVVPRFAVASARFAVTRAEASGVELAVFHHPAHGRNVGRMLDAARAALAYCARELGPYPHRELRIVELPAAWERFTGFALPGTIFLVEDHGFLTDLADRRRVDVVSKRVAHEVAHQWFGYQLSPAALPGASILVETLARHVELRVLATLHGEESVPPVLAYELDRYLSGRAGSDEVPLVEVGDQGYLFYAKGSLVMAASRDLIGEEGVNAVLRSLLADANADHPPTAEDLVARLVARAPPASRQLLDEGWRRIVLYDLGIGAVRAASLADGRYGLTLALGAAKFEVDADGAEHPLPFDEEVELAIELAPDVAGAAATIVRERRRVLGPGELTIDLPARPRAVEIDPRHLRLDRDRSDNRRNVGDTEDPGL